MSAIVCTRDILTSTIQILRRGGERGEERVALWLSTAALRTPRLVNHVYEPDQVAAVDYFNIPPASMRALMSHLRVSRSRIVAQIHTHPGRAFHSAADADWAIVRHSVALSLVLPRFARTTTVSSFLYEVMTYEYSPRGDWVYCPNFGAGARIELLG